MYIYIILYIRIYKNTYSTIVYYMIYFIIYYIYNNLSKFFKNEVCINIVIYSNV